MLIVIFIFRGWIQRYTSNCHRAILLSHYVANYTHNLRLWSKTWWHIALNIVIFVPQLLFTLQITHVIDIVVLCRTELCKILYIWASILLYNWRSSEKNWKTVTLYQAKASERLLIKFILNEFLYIILLDPLNGSMISSDPRSITI